MPERSAPTPAAGSCDFHLARADSEAPARDEREHVAVDPRGGSALAGLGQQAQAATQPTGLAALLAAAIALDSSAANRDLAHAQLLAVDAIEDRSEEHTSELQ